MKKKKIILLGLLVLLASVAFYVYDANRGSKELTYNPPKNGVVQDAVTAIKIAEAVGFPFFGENMKDYMPFKATLEGDSVWCVWGPPKKMWFAKQYGGGPEFRIRKKDGKVVEIGIYR